MLPGWHTCPEFLCVVIGRCQALDKPLWLERNALCGYRMVWYAKDSNIHQKEGPSKSRYSTNMCWWMGEWANEWMNEMGATLQFRNWINRVPFCRTFQEPVSNIRHLCPRPTHTLGCHLLLCCQVWLDFGDYSRQVKVLGLWRWCVLPASCHSSSFLKPEWNIFVVLSTALSDMCPLIISDLPHSFLALGGWPCWESGGTWTYLTV